MPLDIKVKNKLKKHYNKIWETVSADAKKAFETVFPDKKYTTQEIPASFTVYDDQYHDYGEMASTYRLYFNIDDEIKNADDLNKILYSTTVHRKRPDFFYFIKSYSGIKSQFIFKMKPDDIDELKIKFEKEVSEDINKSKSIQQTKQVIEDEELRKLPKSEVLERAKTELLGQISHFWKINKHKSLESLKSDDAYFYNQILKPIIDVIALKWGIGPDDLANMIYLEPLNSEPKSIEKDKFKRSIISTTLARLPRFIYKVVKDVKVLLKKGMRTEGGHYSPTTNSITIRLNDSKDIVDYMHTLAHEYWHAFEHLSGFRRNLKDVFEETVKKVAIGDLGKNTFEDFKIVIQTLSYFGKEDFSEVLKTIEKGWGKKYFKKQRSSIAEDLKEIQQSVEDSNLYITINELLAETLADIVSQKTTRKIPQGLIVWMNKKFSCKNHFIKSEKIVEEILRKTSCQT